MLAPFDLGIEDGKENRGVVFEPALLTLKSPTEPLVFVSASEADSSAFLVFGCGYDAVTAGMLAYLLSASPGVWYPIATDPEVAEASFEALLCACEAGVDNGVALNTVLDLPPS